MANLALVSLGGLLGAAARYGLSELMVRLYSGSFPLSTLTVNVLGCLLIGVLMAVAEETELLAPSSQLFLFTGVLGSFTTFSTFGRDGYALFCLGEGGAALLYLAGSVLLGLLCVWAGRAGALALVASRAA